MQEFKIIVPIQEAGKRLDIFLMDYFGGLKSGLSRTFLQELIKDNKVKINNEVCSKPNRKMKQSEEVIVLVQEKERKEILAEDIPLNVIFEDDDLAVIDKQIGLVVHPAPGNYEHTLVNALLHRFKNLSDINPLRPGIVHRLDKDTSGLIIIAKNNFTHLALTEGFSAHEIKKKYVALVKGAVAFQENIIEMPIGRHPEKRENMAAGFGRDSKYAKTYYKTLKKTRDFSMLELHPYTGRTHQLRVHLAFIGHPIIGDKKYGKNNEFFRLALHAIYLGFTHPRNKKFLEFNSAIPKEFKDFIEKKELKLSK